MSTATLWIFGEVAFWAVTGSTLSGPDCCCWLDDRGESSGDERIENNKKIRNQKPNQSGYD